MKTLIARGSAMLGLHQDRNKRLLRGVASGILTKAFSLGLTIAVVPLTLHHLGPERYGLWVTIFSMLAWLGLMDLGVANGLTPALSAAFGQQREDLARGYVATAFWGLVVLACVGAIAVIAAWGLVDWARLFNTSSPAVTREAVGAMALAIGIFLMTLPLSINQRVLLAYQEGASANAVQLLSNLGGAIGIFIVARSGGGLEMLVIGYTGTQWIVSFAAALWLFGYHRPILRPTTKPNWVEAKGVLGLGGLFFISQISTLLVFQKDPILITYLIGPEAASIYSVAWQLFLYVNAVALLISPFISPGFGEAYARGDTEWIAKGFKMYLTVSLAITVPVILVIVTYHSEILRLWVGNLPEAPESVVYWLGAWALIQAVLGPVVALLIGVGRLSRYAMHSVLAAVVSFVSSMHFIDMYGITGAAIGSVLSYIFILLLPALFEVRNVLKHKD